MPVQNTKVVIAYIAIRTQPNSCQGTYFLLSYTCHLRQKFLPDFHLSGHCLWCACNFSCPKFEGEAAPGEWNCETDKFAAKNGYVDQNDLKVGRFPSRLRCFDRFCVVTVVNFAPDFPCASQSQWSGSKSMTACPRILRNFTLSASMETNMKLSGTLFLLSSVLYIFWPWFLFS